MQSDDKVLKLKPHIEKILKERYYLKEEDSWEQLSKRVSSIYPPIYDYILKREFIPSSPTLMNLNTNGERIGTLSSCFIINVDDNIDNIMESMRETAIITKLCGGVGINWSKLRGSNEEVKSTGGKSGGVLSFIGIFDSILDGIRQGSRRRGAGMSLLSIYNPDILKFINAKYSDTSKYTRSNFSVVIDSKFYDVLRKNPDKIFKTKNIVDGKENILKDDGEVEYTYKMLWDKIIHNAWKRAEPGIFNGDIAIDRCSCKHISKEVFSNPCSEFVHIPYTSCNLASINLSLMINDKNEFDWNKFKILIREAIVYLNQIIDNNKYPLEKISKETLASRPIGLGEMGLAHLLYKLKIQYDSEEASELVQNINKFMTIVSIQKSMEMAKELGKTYEYYDYETFMDANKRFFSKSKFMDVDLDELKENIKKYGVRNSCSISVAPCGTIGYIADCPGGIEPVFGLVFIRKIEKENKTYEEVYIVDPVFEKYINEHYLDRKEKIYEYISNNKGSCQGCDHLTKSEQKVFRVAGDINPNWHLKILSAVTNNINLSVSKCVAKGTKILTNKGLIEIEKMGDAKGEDKFGHSIKGLRVKDANGKWQNVISHYSGGKKPTKIIKFDNGNILECSYTHQLYTCNGWTQSQELNIGDYVYMRSSDYNNKFEGKLSINTDFNNFTNSNFVYLPTKMSSDLALFLGMIASDGHIIESSGNIGITTADDKVEKYFIKLSKKIFKVKKVRVIFDKRTNNTRSIFITSRKLCRYVTNLLNGHNCITKKIPEQIKYGSINEKMSFINGVTLDGYVARNRLTIYAGYSQSMRNDIFSICCELGLKPRKDIKYVKTGNLSKWSYIVSVGSHPFKPIESHKNIKIKDYYIIPVPQKIKSLMYKNIDRKYYSSLRTLRSNNYKSLRTNNSLLKYDPNYDKNLYFQKIVAIENSANDVYDIEVENSHSYLIENIVSHNTINLPADCSEKELSNVFLKAQEMGIIGVTVYREGSREGILLHNNGNGNGNSQPIFIERHDAPKRPTDLECDIHEMNVITDGKSERFIALVGKLAGTVYEIFVTRDVKNKLDLKKHKTGIIRKVKKGQYDLLISNGEDIHIEDIGSVFGGKLGTLSRLVSLSLRHGTPLSIVIDQLHKDTESGFFEFHKCVGRVLKHYIKDGERVITSDVCPKCKSTLIYMEGCKTCPSCGHSHCS